MNRWANNYYGQQSRQGSALQMESGSKGVHFPDAAQERERASRSPPGNVAHLWIYRVVHLTGVTLTSFIGRQGVQVLDIEQVSPDGATYKSFKVMVDEADAPTLLFRTSWPGLVGCRLWKERREEHVEEDPLAETQTKATFSKSLHGNSLRAALGLGVLRQRESFDDSQIALLRSFQAKEGNLRSFNELRALNDPANRKGNTKLRRSFSEDQIPQLNQTLQGKSSSFDNKGKTSKEKRPKQKTAKNSTRGLVSTSRGLRGKKKPQKSARYLASSLPNKKASANVTGRELNTRSSVQTRGRVSAGRTKTARNKSVKTRNRSKAKSATPQEKRSDENTKYNGDSNSGTGQLQDSQGLKKNNLHRKRTGKPPYGEDEKNELKEKQHENTRQNQTASQKTSLSPAHENGPRRRSAEKSKPSRHARARQIPPKTGNKAKEEETSRRTRGKEGVSKRDGEQTESISGEEKTKDVSEDLSKTSRNLKRSFDALHDVNKNKSTYGINGDTQTSVASSSKESVRQNEHDTAHEKVASYQQMGDAEVLSLSSSRIGKDGRMKRKHGSIQLGTSEVPENEASLPKRKNWIILLSELLTLSSDEAVYHLLGSEYDELLSQETVSDDELFMGFKVLAHAARSKSNPSKAKQLAYKVWQPHIIDLIKTFSVTVEKYYPERAENYFWDLSEFIDVPIKHGLRINKLPSLVSTCLSEVLALSYRSYVSEELVNAYRKMHGRIFEMTK